MGALIRPAQGSADDRRRRAGAGRAAARGGGDLVPRAAAPPISPTSLIGREAEATAVAALLAQPDVRLVAAARGARSGSLFLAYATRRYDRAREIRHLADVSLAAVEHDLVGVDDRFGNPPTMESARPLDPQ